MDKWEGEDDAQDAVKDNWDDEDEVEPPKPTEPQGDPNAPKAIQMKKKKKLTDIIAEKEATKQQQLAMTPEEKEAERIRQLKHQEEAELKLIGSTFGVSSISISDPETKPDFDELRKQVVNALTQFEKRTLYGDFLEDLIQDLAIQLPSQRLKKVKTTVEALYFEKSKQEKAKSVKPGKGKAKLRVEGDTSILKPGGVEDFGDEFDDFM